MATTASVFLCVSILFMCNEVFKVAEGSIVDKALEYATSEVLAPLHRVTRDLKEAVSELEKVKLETSSRHSALLQRLSEAPDKCRIPEVTSHALFLRSWDFDSCVNVTDDLKEVSEVVWEGGKVVANLTSELMDVGNNILNCPSLKVWETVSCYNSNLKELKLLVTGFKNVTLPYVREGEVVLKQMRLDFDHCLGIPVTSAEAIERHLENCS